MFWPQVCVAQLKFYDQNFSMKVKEFVYLLNFCAVMPKQSTLNENRKM